MAANEQSMGNLSSKIQLTLHTYHATRAWKGRGVESGKHQIIGVRQFLFLAGRIQQDAAKDDPYADYWMVEIEQKLKECQERLNELLQESDRLLDMIPKELSVEENVNQQPFKTPVFTGGQQGWLAIRLLIDFDRFARNILLAQHVALIGRTEMHAYMREANHLIRSLCTFPQRYPGYSGVSRDDFAANNAKAREAVDKYGEVPADILR
ncbi:PFL_4669 family integrating conjugative element protein, partial [Halomonas sp. THAF12]|uniref:PFL_4669 family integrating conjugative element protein n=1 Tax=Halomonas sp. B23F22_10 TaxID=3459515 RepID=UPI00373EA8F3